MFDKRGPLSVPFSGEATEKRYEQCGGSATMISVDIGCAG